MLVSSHRLMTECKLQKGAKDKNWARDLEPIDAVALLIKRGRVILGKIKAKKTVVLKNHFSKIGSIGSTINRNKMQKNGRLGMLSS